MKRKVALAGAVLAAAYGPAAYAETRVSLASGIDFSSGKYGGDASTEVISVPFVFRVANSSWAFRASTSYLEITGPADVAESDGSGGLSTRTGTQSGLGDANLAFSHTFRRLGGSHAYFETTARARLPIGDEDKGLGVGTTDYGLSGEIGANLSGGGASFELTRRFLGDRTGVERQDGWQVNASSWLRGGERSRLGVFGSWREASIEGNEDPAQLGAFASYDVTPSVQFTLNAAGGLSDASADYSTGLRLTWRLSSD